LAGGLMSATPPYAAAPNISAGARLAGRGDEGAIEPSSSANTTSRTVDAVVKLRPGSAAKRVSRRGMKSGDAAAMSGWLSTSAAVAAAAQESARSPPGAGTAATDAARARRGARSRAATAEESACEALASVTSALRAASRVASSVSASVSTRAAGIDGAAASSSSAQQSQEGEEARTPPLVGVLGAERPKRYKATKEEEGRTEVQEQG
jgi:hypothetical protein